jgi:LysR family transcriptional activator of mexEF-oprN operon
MPSPPPLSTDLNLNLLATLEAILRTGQVSRAAEALGVTQPAVSHSLKRLRHQLGDHLLVRSAGGMTLTPRAQELKATLLPLVRQLQSALQPSVFTPATAQRTFTVCLSDLGEFQMRHEFLEAFRKDAPGCRLRCLHVPVPEIASTLESGTTDVALGGMLPAMPPGLRQRRLFDYDYVCIARAGRGAPRTLTRTAYSASPHAVVSRSGDFDDHIDKPLEQLHLRRNKVISLSTTVAAARLVSQSDLIATVPRLVASRMQGLFPLACVELPVRLPRVVSRMYWHERFHADAANRWLRSLVELHFTLTDQEPS